MTSDRQLSPGDLLHIQHGSYIAEFGDNMVFNLDHDGIGLVVAFVGETNNNTCWRMLIDGVIILVWNDHIINDNRS